jgi:hypothetical protein
MADDGLEITIDGLAGFNAMMSDLGAGQAAERIARRAMRNGGRVIQAAITEAAPVRPPLPSGTALPPGAVKSDIELHVTKEQDGSISSYIEPGRLTKHVVRWLEFGHQMVPAGKKRTRVDAINDGAGFVRVSFESSEAEAIAAIEDTIATEINLAAAEEGAA